MKSTLTRHLFRTALSLSGGALLALALSAHAAVTDLSTAPLASSASTSVKPNVSFVLDSSGSMAWTHAPDEAQPFVGFVGYVNNHCNTMYYDPNIKYVPAKHADGTDYANASFTAALTDPFQSTSTVNLATSFQAYDNTTSYNGGIDTAQAAYYYTYSGIEIPDYQNTSSPFYKECSLPTNLVATATITVAGSSSTSVTNVKVGSTIITTGSTWASSRATSVASRLASAIGAGGYSAVANGTVVTVYATSSSAIGQTPVVTKSGGMTFTVAAFVKTPFTKVTVSASSGPGGTDERQNFANWYTFYRTRILMMKTGAGRAFSAVGSNYRVGFMTIYATPSSSTTDPQYLAINDFTQTQKNSWYSKFYALNAGGGTPLKAAISTAGRNFAGKLGPDPVQYSCQQNFLLVTTDGYWNAGSANALQVTGSTSVGNQDNVFSTIGTPPPATPRPMYDGGLAGSVDTLADATAYYYNTDLRTPALGNCVGALGAGTDVCQNNVFTSDQDPATWQHMTTFTLGLGTNGTLRFAKDYLSGGSADYNAITAGTKNWPTPTGDTLTTIDDLWHAAVNGHGEYFAAKNPDLLVEGIHNALAAAKIREAAGSAAAVSNLQPVQGDNSVFIASYRTVKWDGDVQARTLNLQTGQLDPNTVWSAQAQLDTQTSTATDSRNIFTFVGGVQKPFTTASFTSAQLTSWFTPTASPALSQTGGWTAAQTAAATPDSLITYLRGQTGFEERTANAIQLYRMRDHVLGDVVDAQPVYVHQNHFFYADPGYAAFNATQASRTPVVYTAANDGMVHAFNAQTGNEMWAYIPSFVLPNLKALADDLYSTQHQYYVDGSPNSGDVYVNGNWKSILVGGLAGGGKGWYCLDITNPASPVVMWEYTETNMGYSYGQPVIGKLSDGTWVVVVTSGYNGPDGVGRLYVLDAGTGTLKFTVSTGVGTASNPSGLSKITGYTTDGLTNNVIERIYGGDLLGNVWRFDINDTIPPAGKEAFLLGQLIAGGKPQPITTSPELGDYLYNGVNYHFVFVGTGKYLGNTDLTDTSQQSLYGLVDKFLTSGGTTGIGDVRNAPTCPIVQQTLAASATSRTISNNPVNPSTNCGWYVDFNPGNTTPGERVNVDMTLQLGILTVATNVPANTVCSTGGTSWLYYFDYTNGSNLPAAVGGVAGKQYDSSLIVGITTVQVNSGSSNNNTNGGPLDTLVVTSTGGAGGSAPPPPKNLGAGGKRLMWRELLN